MSWIVEGVNSQADLLNKCMVLEALGTQDARYRRIIRAVADARPGDYDAREVRVRISRPGLPDVFIDRHGGVSVDGKVAALSSGGRSRVERILKKMNARAERAWEAKVEAAAAMGYAAPAMTRPRE